MRGMRPLEIDDVIRLVRIGLLDVSPKGEEPQRRAPSIHKQEGCR